MKIRRESVQTRSEIGSRRREALRHTRAVCRRAERRDCPSQPRIRACSRSSMNHAGSVEARDKHVCDSCRPKPSLFVPQLEAIPPSHNHEISGACIGIAAPLLHAANLSTRVIFRFRSIGNTYSHGIAKRVTPLRRCESIRSLNRRLGTALPV